ncbi:hypothetical protein [Helicobacter sp. T3_23-1056]
MRLFFMVLLSFCLCYGTGERLLDERVAKLILNKQYQITSIKRAGLEYCLDYEQLRQKSLSKEEQKSFFPYEYNRFELYLPFDKLIAIKAYKQYVDSYLQWINGLSQDDFYKHFNKIPNVDNKFEILSRYV